MLVDRIAWQSRPPVPDPLQQIQMGQQAHFAGLQSLLQLPGGGQRHHCSIDGHRSLVPNMLTKPLQRPWLARQQLHQLDATARQFMLGLLPVAAIGPQPGEIGRDDQSPY